MIVSEHDDVRLLKSEEEIWNEALTVLQKQLPIGVFNGFVKHARLTSIDDSGARLSVHNAMGKTLISNSAAVVRKVLCESYGKQIELIVSVDDSLQPSIYEPSIGTIQTATGERAPDAPRVNPVPRRPEGRPVTASQLDPRHTFDSFVVGSNNRFCHSAAMAVAKNPGQAYSPLFIHGGVGLGKTHIMHAIGQEIMRHSPSLNILYVSCERFTNELITAIGSGNQLSFRKRYRQVDVLLVDDIQFIEKKEATQEEFFHTFNSLREAGKQIVLSSDRPPKSFQNLEERLRSRFEWGLTADIQPPDLETRVAILQRKCQLENFACPDDVLEYIATIYKSNIRELEGALINARAYANLTGEPVTVKSIGDVLQPGRPVASEKPQVTIDALIQIVATHFRLEASEIRSSKRTQDLVIPRHIAMYLAHELLQMSFPRIGTAFSNRAHTSALHAHGRIRDLLATDPQLNETLRQIRRKLND